MIDHDDSDSDDDGYDNNNDDLDNYEIKCMILP